jgi:hypothetical protein
MYWIKTLCNIKIKKKKYQHILDDIDDYWSHSTNKRLLIQKYWHVLKDARKNSDSIDYCLKIPNTEKNLKEKINTDNYLTVPEYQLSHVPMFFCVNCVHGLGINTWINFVLIYMHVNKNKKTVTHGLIYL